MPINIKREVLEEFSHFELLAKQVVEGFITGMHKSPFHGFSVEFAEHKLYNKGDSTRHVDWKLFARTEKLFIKRYEEETNLRCQIIIDDSASMLYPTSNENTSLQQLNKLGFSALAAAAIMHLMKSQQDACGLHLYSEDIEQQFQAKSSGAHFKNLYSGLELLMKKKMSQSPSSTSIVKSIHHIAETLPRRSLIILFTDLYDSTENLEAIFNALLHLRHNKHEVILFHTTSNKTELNFDFVSGPHTFVDIETKEEIKLNPAQVKDLYLKEYNSFLLDIKNKCFEAKIDLVEANIDQGFDTVLKSYLIKRKTMLR